MTKLPRSPSGKPIKGALLSTPPYPLQSSSRMSPTLSTMLTHKSSTGRSQDSSSRVFVLGGSLLVPMVNTTSSACGSFQRLRNHMAHTRSPHQRRCVAHGIPLGRNFGHISVQCILGSTNQTMESFRTLTVVSINAAGRDAFGVFLLADQMMPACICDNTSRSLRKELPRLNWLVAKKLNSRSTRGTIRQQMRKAIHVVYHT